MQNEKLKIINKMWTKKGFTLVEMFVVIAIIAGLAALVVPMLGGVREKAAIITTLNEMKSIKEAIRDRFYPDIGLIPEDSAKPEYATRYLCLRDDGGAGKPEYDEMCTFVGSDDLMTWDKYSRKGWRGPYMEQEHCYYAISDDKWFPILTDAWGRSVNSAVDPDEVIGEYLILGGQDENSARIVSFGANGDDDSESGDDIVMWIFGTQPIHFPEGFNPADWGG